MSANVATSRLRFHTRNMPAPLLHEHGVDVGGRRQPRHQRRVLDRVPRPHARPAEHLVAPPAAEQDADRQEAPREQRPPARLEQPALADATGDQRRHRERERHGEPDVAEIEDRRVEQHQRVVLQQRVRSGTVEADRHLGTGRERVGRTERDQSEERRHDEHHDQRPADEHVVESLAEPPRDRRREPRQDRRPRAGSSPRARSTSRRRCRALGVVDEPTCWMYFSE